jgi:hypothetical protein
MKAVFSKEEIVQTIQRLAAELGHAPSYGELAKHSKITMSPIRKHFGNYRLALVACGLECRGTGFKIGLRELFLDWAALVRSLGRVPSIDEYQTRSRYSIRGLVRRFQRWSYVPAALLEYCRAEGLEGEWKDVCEVILVHLSDTNYQTNMLSLVRPMHLPDQPVYGMPLAYSPLTYAPTHESGVIFLFGVLAQELRFAVTRIQPAFPDCEAMHEVRPGQWQKLRIEFEFESRNFLIHGHSPDDCDLIVCWNHNWEGCTVEVLELKQEIVRLARITKGGI